MPIIKTQNGYIYKKTTKQTKHNKALFVFLLFLVSVVVACGVLFVFARVDITSALKLNKYQIFSQTNYYAVSVASGENFSDVSADADMLKLADGAGFVLKQNGKYYLIASIYSTSADANAVAQNILDYQCQVVNVCLKNLIINQSFLANQINALKYALQLVNRAYQTLTDIVQTFDRAELLDAEARQKLQVFRETCQQDKTNFDLAFQNNYESIVTSVKIFQAEVISSLSALLISKNLSSDIKYAICGTISGFCTLQTSVTKN